MTSHPLVRLVGSLAVVALAACGTQAPAAQPSTTAATAAADGVTIDVVSIAFKPAEIRVLRSTKVTWANADEGVAHTVTSGLGGSNAVPGVSDAKPNQPDGTFDGDLPADGEFSFTFNELGEFAYFCEIHPSMRATVVVE